MTIECQDHTLVNYDNVVTIRTERATLNGKFQITAYTRNTEEATQACLGVYETEDRANNALTNLKYALSQNRSFSMPQK